MWGFLFVCLFCFVCFLSFFLFFFFFFSLIVLLLLLCCVLVRFLFVGFLLLFLGGGFEGGGVGVH